MESLEVSYSQLEPLLQVSDLSPSPSEAHGIFCGLLCAGAEAPIQRLLAELLPTGDAVPAEVGECARLLTQLAEAATQELNDPARAFALPLPDADVELIRRVLAVYDWNRGFLYGIALAGPNAKNLSAPLAEALDDCIELTRMDCDAVEGLDPADAEAVQALEDIADFLGATARRLYEERVR